MNTIKKTSFMLALAFVSMLAPLSCRQAGNENTSASPEGITSPVIETIMARRSVRAYKPVPVSRDTMNVILECGINAPNGMNRQSWEIRVVDNAEAIAEVTSAFLAVNPKFGEDPGFVNMFRNAPVVAFIACNPAYGMSQIDCGLLGGNMVIAAKSLGIGSCCLGGPVQFLKSSEGKFFLDKLAFSDGYELLYAIAFGYPAENPEAKPRDKSKIVFVD